MGEGEQAQALARGSGGQQVPQQAGSMCGFQPKQHSCSTAVLGKAWTAAADWQLPAMAGQGCCSELEVGAQGSDLPGPWPMQAAV